LSASTVIEVSGSAWHRKESRVPSSSGLRRSRPWQVALGELVGVRDDRRSARQVADVRLERGRVHRDQHVGRVARCHHVVVGEVQLEARDAGQRALRGTDLGREVGQGGQVVAESAVCAVKRSPVS
jgi:hypothetical protein